MSSQTAGTLDGGGMHGLEDGMNVAIASSTTDMARKLAQVTYDSVAMTQRVHVLDFLLNVASA